MKFEINQKVRVTGHGIGTVWNYNHRYKEYEIKMQEENGGIIRGIKEHQLINKEPQGVK